MERPKVRIREDLFGRWIVVSATKPDLAWSGSRWVPITKQGFPASAVQVSNLRTESAAAEYARSYGFEIEDEAA
jgi:hypothetical protein